jgi:hypothetical protein
MVVAGAGVAASGGWVVGVRRGEDSGYGLSDRVSNVCVSTFSSVMRC